MSETVEREPNYGAVFLGLFVFTILEIAAANARGIAKPVVIGLLLILASLKASLVALFYMGLKFEKYIFYVIAIFPLLLAAILTLLMLADKPTALSL